MVIVYLLDQSVLPYPLSEICIKQWIWFIQYIPNKLWKSNSDYIIEEIIKLKYGLYAKAETKKNMLEHIKVDEIPKTTGDILYDAILT